MKYLIPDDAMESIESIDVDPENFSQKECAQVTLRNKIGNRFFYKSISANSKINVDFSGSVDSVVFVGENFIGNIDVKIRAPGCILYIGNDCRLRDVTVKLRAADNGVFVGNCSTTSGENTWIAASASPNDRYVIIGDDCMFSWDITVRNDDAHPILDTRTLERVNVPRRGVLIEPHCWIAQRVSVLKNVRIGACSIVGLGSVVTKSAPRFSSISGVPASVRDISGKIWTRGTNRSTEHALKYVRRYADPAHQNELISSDE